MAAFSSTPFVSLAKCEGTLQLSGAKAAYPLTGGQTIAAYGLFDDGTATDVGVFVVLRCSGKNHCYDLSPLGSIDPYWGEHLGSAPSVAAKLLSRLGEKPTDGVEQLTRWRIIAEAGTPPDAAELEMLGKTGAENALKKWHFLADYVVSDVKAGNDPPPLSGN